MSLQINNNRLTDGCIIECPLANSNDNNNDEKLLIKKISSFLKEINKSQKIGKPLNPEQFRRMSNGNTDATFACTSTVTEPKEKFFLKLAKPIQIANARFCSKILSELGEKTSKIHLINDKNESRNRLKDLAKNTPGGNRGLESCDLAFMEACPGSDLGCKLDNGTLFDLDQESWEKLLKTIGRVAVFDLAIGNNDRFYRPKINVSPEGTPPFCNVGNFILFTETVEGRIERLNEIYCIDNGSSKEFIPKNKKSSNETNLYSDETNLYLEYLKSFKDAFSTFLNPEKHEKFAQIIYKGIELKLSEKLNALSEDLRRKFQDQDQVINALCSGIRQGYTCLSQKNHKEMEAFLSEHLDTDAPSDISELLCTISGLVLTCLNLIKKDE